MGKLTRCALVAVLAAGAVSSCRGDLTNPGTTTPGNFFVEIGGGHKDTTAAGEALFTHNVEDGTVLLSLFLVTRGANFQLVFEVHDFEGITGEHDLGAEPDRYLGEFYYTGGGDIVTYRITGGTFVVEQISSRRLVGELSFQAIALDGPNPGSTSTIHGDFSAACDGECSGGGPPPG